jgi:hypothetical protein
MKAIRRFSLPLLLVYASLLPGQGKKKQPPGDRPTVLWALPFGVKPGAAARVTLRGLKLANAKEVRVAPKGTAKLLKKGKSPPANPLTPEKVGDSEVEVELSVPADAPGDSVQVTVVGPGGPSKPHPVRIDRAPIVEEKEPNDGFRQAQAVTIGQAVQGAISKPRDVDVFRFEGKAGQKVVIEVHAARYGSPLDSVLTLYDAGGATLESCDDIEGSTDSRIEATLPKAGTYHVAVSDAHDRGASFFLYRLSIRAK